MYVCICRHPLYDADSLTCASASYINLITMTGQTRVPAYNSFVRPLAGQAEMKAGWMPVPGRNRPKKRVNIRPILQVIPPHDEITTHSLVL